MTSRALPTITERSASFANEAFEARGPQHDAAVDLYWLPLGAGGRSVRLNGRIFEAVSARVQRREPGDLYHSALEVRLGPRRYVIEMAPVWNERATERGAVAEGAVGIRQAGRLRLFRYEIRCWRDGRIPDIDEAVESPVELTNDPGCARRVLELVRHVPAPVWGRDELRTGDMWNSNSVVSWLIARSEIATPYVHDGLRLPGIQPPAGGRAPGWDAGLVVACRQTAAAGLSGQRPRPRSPVAVNASPRQ